MAAAAAGGVCAAAWRSGGAGDGGAANDTAAGGDACGGGCAAAGGGELREGGNGDAADGATAGGDAGGDGCAAAGGAGLEKRGNGGAADDAAAGGASGGGGGAAECSGGLGLGGGEVAPERRAPLCFVGGGAGLSRTRCAPLRPDQAHAGGTISDGVGTHFKKTSCGQTSINMNPCRLPVAHGRLGIISGSWLTTSRRARPSCRHRRTVVVGHCRRHQRRPPAGRPPNARPDVCSPLSISRGGGVAAADGQRINLPFVLFATPVLRVAAWGATRPVASGGAVAAWVLPTAAPRQAFPFPARLLSPPAPADRRAAPPAPRLSESRGSPTVTTGCARDSL
ncbi:hypothetical protein BU14_0014s0054 [Porphyra umbilicalis]|uniref:Uncharacterized protein n=1 Tax=Porphyra umbilicalis TaxID=2786 RepID=A0A1X6PKR6_PORUM|nr:hypothetical protein BU14_0014s0054 [Porphyra umbilicalis]|eukprot:OSX81504.1 hypothetical protein BU14_0014s0054 [Porphyra umbilicalis]